MGEQSPQLPDTEQLFEQMPCGLLVTAVDGTILRVNSTFCLWTGFPAQELVGKMRLQELLSMGARIFHHTHWLPMLQLQGSISEVKFDVRQRSGKLLPMLFNVVRRTADTVTYDEISAVIAEERNKYERELLAARKRADSLASLEKDRTLFAEQMIGIVSHDLRNPLSVIMLATKVLATKGAQLTDDDAQRMLSSIGRAGERAQRLIEDLLDFTVARIGQGLTVAMKPIDLHEVAAKAVEEFRIAHPTRDIRYVRSGEGVIEADAHRLTQLLGNLVSNALTYGEPAGTVTIVSELAGNEGQLAVHNTGAAIPKSVQASMFEPMVRGDTDTTSRSVGLGLYIVRAIARAHRGEVSVTSGADTGTRFTLTFPRTGTI
jgi:sigma-B regulation protein RsbU (phosphoserine phosphatase)